MSDLPFPAPRDPSVTEVIDWFSASPEIGAQLPLRVDNGGVLNRLDAECGQCARRIPDGYFRGAVTFPFDQGPVVVQAYGYCRRCNVFTPFDYRLRGRNGTMIWEYRKDGVWVHEQVSGGRFRALLDAVRRLAALSRRPG